MTVVEPMKAGTFTVSSGYGSRKDPFSGTLVVHAGLDYAAATGTPIYAVADGVVVEGRDRTDVEGFGSWIWLDCQESVGRDFIYGHVVHSRILVTAGDRVKAGQQIGVVGNEGNSTGPHLHFEVWGPPGRVGGNPEDPAAWLTRHVTKRPQGPNTPEVEKKEATMAQFQADLTILSPNDDGVRNGPPQFACVHTFEAPRNMTARSMAEYQTTPAAQGSYHVVADGAGKTARENDDHFRPWAAGYTGNLKGMHLSFGAYARDSRALWLAHDLQLRAGARVVADWCKRYGIPVRKITADELRRGVKGICGHADVSAAWREVNHTDPGPNFPWDVFLTYVQAYVGGATVAPAPAPAAPAPVDLETFDQTLAVIRQQLTGDPNAGYPGWSQLDQRSLVDGLAVIGTKLGVPGFSIPGRNDGAGPVEYREAKVDTIRHQLTGGRFSGYPGWPQLGGRTVVDAIAAIGAHLTIPGFRDLKK